MEMLDVQPGQTVVDATVGMGGHAERIASRLGPSGRLIAIDRDPHALAQARARVSGCRADFLHGTFGRLRMMLDELGVPEVDAVLADLGVSSPQLDVAERGFSFRREGPLDMRMDPAGGPTAAELLATLSERDLAWIFWEYGEERYSRRIAKRIVEARSRDPLRTTTQLAELVRGVVPRSRSARKGGAPAVDPATRVFQALRIAVNDELGELDSLLASLPVCVRAGGRAVVVSFHSLEDRRVKHAFRNRDLWEILTKSPMTASEEETQANPRARSAKLRAAIRRTDSTMQVRTGA